MGRSPMSTQRNRSGTTEGSTGATVLDTDRSTTPHESRARLLPPVNQIISDEVELFFSTRDQSQLTSADVEFYLLNQINNRLLSENAANYLKGARSYRTIQTFR